MQIFFLKFIDSILTTFKSIYLFKNKQLLSSIFGAIANFVYMLILVDTHKAMLVGLATFMGSQVSFIITNRFEKDKVFLFDVKGTEKEASKQFADVIRENNIPILTYLGYNDFHEKVLCCKIYSQSKEQSHLIKSLIPQGFKYDIQEIKNYVGG